MNSKITHSISKILGLTEEDENKAYDEEYIEIRGIDNIKCERSRARRARTNFNKDAINYLEEMFKINPYPDINERERLAQKVDTTEARIQVWFQNKRSRNRRKVQIKSKDNNNIETSNESFTSNGSGGESFNTFESSDSSPNSTDVSSISPLSSHSNYYNYQRAYPMGQQAFNNYEYYNSFNSSY